jgi:hypothetical protein
MSGKPCPVAEERDVDGVLAPEHIAGHKAASGWAAGTLATSAETSNYGTNRTADVLLRMLLLDVARGYSLRETVRAKLAN